MSQSKALDLSMIGKLFERLDTTHRNMYISIHGSLWGALGACYRSEFKSFLVRYVRSVCRNATIISV